MKIIKTIGLASFSSLLLSHTVFAGLAELAQFNANQFVQQTDPQAEQKTTLQQLVAKSRTQPLSPAENQQMQQLLLATGNNATANNTTTANSTTAQTAVPVSNASVSDQAFAGVTQQLMPMTPDQIRMMKQMYNDRMKASVASPSGAPRPVSSSMFVNLAPGSTPPVVRCSSGFISTLVFLDASGQPWPVDAVDNGDPQSYNVRPTGNSLMVQALSEFKSANIAVILKGLDTPIMVTLMAGQQEVDYRVDMRIPKMGPNATATVSGLPSSEDPQLLNILDGVPPQNAQSVQIDGGNDCQAWVIGDKLFLRTRMNLMSPSWISTMSSADGTHAYELEKAPVLLALQHGQMVRLTVEGL